MGSHACQALAILPLAALLPHNQSPWADCHLQAMGAALLHVIFLSREGRDLGVAFQAPPGSQASSRGEAKDSALLSSP